MTTAERVRELVAASGADVEAVSWSGPSEQPPPGPSHQWVVWTTPQDEVVLGGWDHGTFSAYGRFADAELAAEVLQRWVAPALPPAPRDDETLHLAAVEVADRMLMGGSGPLTQGDVEATALPPGTPLDHIGDTSGHVLHLYGTAFSARSLPPTEVNVPRFGLLLEQRLPQTCVVRLVQPWFGQPGGGISVVLDRPIAYYLDRGYVQAFEVATR